MKNDLDGNRPHPTGSALTPVQQDIVNMLDYAALCDIDEAILRNVRRDWRKGAMIVGLAMQDQKNRVEGVPDLFYWQRVIALVEKGILAATGDLTQMGHSEVRYPLDGDDAN